MTWHEQAACAGRAPLFDGHLHGEDEGTRMRRQAAAVAICELHCPVRDQCRADTVRGRDEGVRGGVILPDSSFFARSGKPIEHGKPSGYQAHRRTGEKPCRACLDARNRAKRDAEARRASGGRVA